MAKVEDCPGFETFGADVKAAREAKRLARKTLAEMVGIEWRYLANIENLPSSFRGSLIVLGWYAAAVAAHRL